MRKSAYLFLIVVLIALDLITKQWVTQTLLLGEVVPVIPGLNLTLAHNTGAAFSFLANEGGWQRIVLSTIAMLVSFGFFVWLMRTPAKQRWTCFGLACIIGGAIGNLCDRIYYGYVIDFIDVYVGVHHWPAFNVADSAICVGAVLLLTVCYN